MKKTVTKSKLLFRSFTFIAFLSGSTTQSVAQTTAYPFTGLPSVINATFNIKTGATEKFNNKLLGANISGFTSTDEKELIRKFDPITLRFPSVVWINCYDWTVDGNRIYDDYVAKTYNGVPDSSYIKMINSNLKAKTGFPGLTALNTEKKQASGKGYDMLWGYNLNYDDNAKSIARLRDSEAKGFEVNYIEMGNEQFYANQRSNITSTPQKYVAVAKSLSSNLHRVKPGIQVSVPLAWRTGQSYIDYNKALTADTTYFDAVSIHKYVGSDPDIPASFTYKDVLAGRLLLEKDVNYARSLANTKPVWLTEWGVSAGSDCQAAAALGMADCYLFLFENQKIYERADWYGVNGLLNSFVTFVGTSRTIKYPLEKTGYGSVYEILRSVFENSTLLDDIMTTTKLTNTLGSINAVSARAVVKDGKTTVFAVNLTDKPVNFIVKTDGVLYNGSFVHEALKFANLTEDRILPIDSNPLSLVKSGVGQVTLPPLSVNKISNIVIQSPYSGLPLTIPGVLEAENYDKGGESISYSDASLGNTGGVYRTDGVDIGTIANGYSVGWTSTDEWLEYTINVPTSGSYNFNMFYASGIATGGVIGATLPEENITLFTGITLPQTSNWNTYDKKTKYGIPLTAGKHILRINIEQKGFNLDRIEILAPLQNSPAIEYSTETEKLTVDKFISNNGVFSLTETEYWEVYSVNGVKIKSSLSSTINLQGFNKGLYILKTKTGIRKLILN